MNINPLFQAVRAIGTEFVRRIYFPIVWSVGTTLFVILFVVGWLTTQAIWWWFLLGPIILLTLAFILVAAIVGYVIQRFRPAMTSVQKKGVSEMVDKLQDVSETVQTPRIVLIFQLVKDIVRPSEQGLVRKMTSHAVNLKPDFQKVVDSFK